MKSHSNALTPVGFRNKSLTPALAGILFFAAFSFSSKATLIFDEGFGYANGSLTTVSGGAWLNNPNGGGSAGQLQVSGEKALVTFSNGEDAYRSLGSNISTGTLYYSVALDMTALPSTAGNYVFHLSDTDLGTDTDFFARVYVKASGSQYQVGIKNRSTFPTDYTPVYNTAVPLDLNTQVTLVVKFDFATRQSTLWINPVNESSASVTDLTAVAFSGADQTLSRFQIREATGIGTSQVDGILVGTTFGDVLPVPEPSVVALLTLSLGTTMLVVRRRKAVALS